MQVFDLTKQQEITKAQELKTEEAKHLALQSQHATVSLHNAFVMKHLQAFYSPKKLLQCL